MKKIVLLTALIAAGSTWLTARGNDGERGEYIELFEKPAQGQVLANLEGEVVYVEGIDRPTAVFQTADRAYLLPPRFMMVAEEGSKLTIDAYVLEPKEAAELEDFEFEGQKILPALYITMASDADGEPIMDQKYGKGRGRGRSHRNGRSRGRDHGDDKY